MPDAPRKRIMGKEPPKETVRPSALKKPKEVPTKKPSERTRDFLKAKKAEKVGSAGSSKKSSTGSSTSAAAKVKDTKSSEKCSKKGGEKALEGKKEKVKALIQQQKEAKMQKTMEEKRKVEKGKKKGREEVKPNKDKEKEKAKKEEKEEQLASKKRKAVEEKKEKSEKKEKKEEKKEKQEEKKDKNDKKNKDPPIIFHPCKRAKVEELFKTPEKRTTVAGSDAGSLSSKERAELHLKSLGNILEESDDDSSCPATDMEEFLAEVGNTKNDKNDETEDGEEEEDESESQEEPESEEEDSGLEEAEKEKEDEVGKEGCEDADDKEGSAEDEGSDEDEEGDEEEDDVEAEDPTIQADQHALVPVTANTCSTVATLRNSTTHKLEWDAFTRQLKSNAKVPCQLSEYAQVAANKTDLFGMWLDSGRDWSQCQILLERKIQQKNESQRGWQAVQGRALKEKYKENPDKLEKLIQSRKASGLWYPDDDFPDDDDESRLLWSVRNGKNYIQTQNVEFAEENIDGTWKLDLLLYHHF